MYKNVEEGIRKHRRGLEGVGRYRKNWRRPGKV